MGIRAPSLAAKRLQVMPTIHLDLVLQGKEGEGMLDAGLNSVALVRERTIPTERPPPPVGEVSANFCG
jgi:hypothetical protein